MPGNLPEALQVYRAAVTADFNQSMKNTFLNNSEHVK